MLKGGDINSTILRMLKGSPAGKNSITLRLAIRAEKLRKRKLILKEEKGSGEGSQQRRSFSVKNLGRSHGSPMKKSKSI